MTPADRTRLTKALAQHVAAIAADLRAQMATPGPVRDRARKLHTDEQVGDDFDVWTDLLSRRAAVLWVLKTVYVRVLEDRKLLVPGRLIDREAQALFEKLAPNLGDTAFLRWVFRDLASPRGGLPELFAPQPAEVAVPSDARSHALLEFWRHKEADTGFTWSFAGEEFAGELMGDLYQELDPVVKDRYALCQTPDFVRDFMLGQTLTPAMAELGGDAVRLLDPACGSGHFLLDGLRRIVASTAVQHPDWDKRAVVDHALDRVVGIDLNDYACALARARMVMTAAELSGVQSLAEAARFHPHVYWADGLEQVERDEVRMPVQLDLLGDGAGKEAPPRAVLTRPFVRAVLRPILKKKFQVVVGNPPYITEQDPARKEYHREKVGKKRRYVSAHRDYSLVGPFIERSLQLVAPDGWIGAIVGNNFMKRDFGRPLIEEVLAGVDLTHVIDLSHATVPHHKTPVAIVFVRARPPALSVIRVATGRKGERGEPSDPAKGRVWVGLVEKIDSPGFEDEFVSILDVPREQLSHYPWALGDSDTSGLKMLLESASRERLRDVVTDIGRTSNCGEDPAFVMSRAEAARLGLAEISLDLITGDLVRDWMIFEGDVTVYPYDSISGPPIPATHPSVRSHFWRYRTLLRGRTVFGRSTEARGDTWYGHLERYTSRMSAPNSLVYAEIATHNHFALAPQPRLTKQTAPVFSLRDEDGGWMLSLLAVMNSSAACFWMKQTFYPKGSKTKDVDAAGTLPENNRYAMASGGMLAFPLPILWRDAKLARLAGDLIEKAKIRASASPTHVLQQLGSHFDSAVLRAALQEAESQDAKALLQMKRLQEDIDWRVYSLYGVVGPSEVQTPGSVRDSRRESPALVDLLETPVCKRQWRGKQGIFGRYDRTYRERTLTALTQWLEARVELVFASNATFATLGQVVAALGGDLTVDAVAVETTGRRDYSLESLIRATLAESAVPLHPFHRYTASGLVKYREWERVWAAQAAEDAGGPIVMQPLSEYIAKDYCRPAYFRTRGPLDVPKEAILLASEVPGRSVGETLYGWAGWTPLERVKALLALDEQCEDQGIALADRIALLDSAWRLLPDIARDDAVTAARLKAELAALVGADGPSKVLLDAWKAKFPPPGGRGRAKKAPIKAPEDEEED